MRLSRIISYTLVSLFLGTTVVCAQKTTTSVKSSTTSIHPTTTISTTTTNLALPTGNSTIPSNSSSNNVTTTTTTSNIPSPTSSIGNTTLNSCPGPLIPNVLQLQIPTCVGSCCIKCPAFKSFLPPGRTDGILNATYVVRQISMGCAIFLAISYLVLPGKRSQPHISVLFLVISLSLWYAAFDIMPGRSNACVNEFEESKWSNSRLCAVQGVLIIYLAQTSVLWCALLIYKLHLLAVWQCDIIDRYYKWLFAFCWIFPLGFAIPIAAKKLSQFPGIGFSCLVSTDHLNLYLFYPMAVYIYPALLCHAVTFAKMIQLAILSSKVDSAMSQLSANARMKFTSSMQAKRLLRGQWRPALMLGTVMASITVFWLFYYVDTRRMANVNSKTEWLLQWLECLKSSASEGLSSDEAQTVCSALIKSNLPSIPWFGAAETLIAIIGIVIAVVFVTKVDFWTEWLSTVSGFFTKDKPDPDKEQQTSSVIDKPSGVDQNPSHSQYNDTIIRKGTRVGYNDELPTHVATDNEDLTLPRLESFEVPQWYNMDDLLAQEYGQNDTNIQMSTSHGSKHGMTSASNQMPNTEPPHYLAKDSHDPNSGDILSPPVEELEPWILSSPSNAYLVANDSSDRYVEQPVVPRPVPRASSLKREKVQQQHQNQQDQEQLPSTSQSLPFVQKSLSPMPPKPLNQSPAPFLPRKKESDSVPIINIQGSPATSNANPSSTNKAALVGSNESNNKTLQVSGESSTNLGNSSFIGRGLNKIRSSELLGRISPKTKAALEAQIKNQIPPTIPQKSPARRQNSVSSKSQHQYQPPQQQSEGQRSYLQSRSPPTSPVESTQ